MYSEQDLATIDRRIRKNWIAWLIPIAALAALFILALTSRTEWLCYAALVLLAAAGVFGFAYFQLPCLRYRRFLSELKSGLSREMSGRVVEISEAAQLQDGARVLPVRLWLEDDQDERIVYLNASKRALFPGEGAFVQLKLCGRHILEVLSPQERTAQ